MAAVKSSSSVVQSSSPSSSSTPTSASGVKSSPAVKASSSEFDADLFETRLEALKDTQDGIQQMSAWCLQHRSNHKKIVASWLNVFKRVRVEHRLVLFYLANDVIQYSKRKRYEFVESWATALQRATTMVRDEKVKSKILRIFHIWEQRDIYSEEYLSDLSGLLNITRPKKLPHSVETSDEFQNTTLISNIRHCVQLSDTTDKSFKKLPKAPISDFENFKNQLKDKSHSEDMQREIERYITYMEAFNRNLQAEIKSRKKVLTDLDTAIKFYANQRGEVKVVVSAYKNFGTRIKLVKKKLDEMAPNLPSPIPSPDINAPSPEPDADLQLPDDQQSISLNIFKNSINGYSSYMDGKLPFDINDFKRDEGASKSSSQPIEVIGTRSDDESFNSSSEYFKTDSINVYSGETNIPIPGINPVPLPPVQCGYSSLARGSADQYNGTLPSSNTARFNNNLHHNNMPTNYSDSSGYTNYNTENNYSSGTASNSYSSASTSTGGTSMPAFMPPPPIPPTLGGGSGTQSNSSEDFNSNWNLNMSWTQVNTSSTASVPFNQNAIDTPVSPPHFERESHTANPVTIEYSEHDPNILAAQDVDHRQLHVSSFNAKLGLSKDKTRQLDIDHRNLISLTGSPRNNSDKKQWPPGKEETFSTNLAGDIDYRTSVGHAIKTIESVSVTTISNKESPTTPPSNIPALPVSNVAKKTSVTKSSSTSAQEPLKDEANSTRYEPTDMVVDMDMSEDEEFDEAFKEVNEQQSDQFATSEVAADGGELHKTVTDCVENADVVNASRNALLETPSEYLSQNIWDPAALQQMNVVGGYPAQNMSQQQPQAQQWNQMDPTWNGSGGGTPGRSMVPPPPRPPFPFQFQYSNAGFEYGTGIGANGSPGQGRGRGWTNASPNQFRSYPRPQRGGGGHPGNPFFNRGGRGRSLFRGKFRGNNSWM